MIKSKFTFNAFLIPFFIMALVGSSILIIIGNWPITGENLRLIDIYISCIFILAICWLLLGEFRTKVIIVEIANHSIRKKNYLGLDKDYEFRYFDGFFTSIIRSKRVDYEYLYLIKGNIKAIKLFEFYHQNYAELKNEVSKHSKELGFEQFSYLDEIKEIFK